MSGDLTGLCLYMPTFSLQDLLILNFDCLEPVLHRGLVIEGPVQLEGKFVGHNLVRGCSTRHFMEVDKR